MRGKGGKHFFLWSNMRLDTNGGEIRVYVTFSLKFFISYMSLLAREHHFKLLAKQGGVLKVENCFYNLGKMLENLSHSLS
jgi:hypothetical protein